MACSRSRILHCCLSKPPSHRGLNTEFFSRRVRPKAFGRFNGVKLVNAQNLAEKLKARRYGSYWMAHCPAHGDRTPSLSITESKTGKLLVHCHAGCEQSSVVHELKSAGLWDQKQTLRSGNLVKLYSPISRTPEIKRKELLRTSSAMGIWRACNAASDSLVRTYLIHRGIDIPLPLSIRFHPGLQHPSGDLFPAMIGLISNGKTGNSLGIHRTFLSVDGNRKAGVQPEKMMLGPCNGGCIRLAEPSEILMIGEGIETCMAAMQATALPAWASLSASGMVNLDLPNSVYNIIILADGDSTGEAASLNAAAKWKKEGRRVRIASAPAGLDFNDLLVKGVPGEI